MTSESPTQCELGVVNNLILVLVHNANKIVEETCCMLESIHEFN